MNIRIDPHTLARLSERGIAEDEIRDVLLNGEDIPAKAGRKGKAMVYPYRRERLGKFYEHKRVEVIYVQEEDTLVTVTAYAFYGRWE
jgi:hypothetical protein